MGSLPGKKIPLSAKSLGKLADPLWSASRVSQLASRHSTSSEGTWAWNVSLRVPCPCLTATDRYKNSFNCAPARCGCHQQSVPKTIQVVFHETNTLHRTTFFARVRDVLPQRIEIHIIAILQVFSRTAPVFSANSLVSFSGSAFCIFPQKQSSLLDREKSLMRGRTETGWTKTELRIAERNAAAAGQLGQQVKRKQAEIPPIPARNTFASASRDPFGEA